MTAVTTQTKIARQETASSVRWTSLGPVTLVRLLTQDLTGWLALAYTAALPFDGYAVGGRSLPFWIGLVYLVARAADAGARRPKTWPISRGPVVAMALYVVLSAATVGWSYSPDLTIARVITLVQLLLLTPLLAGDLPRVFPLVPRAFAVTAAFLAVLVLQAPENVDQRRTAYGDANEVALALFMGCAAALWLCVNGKLWRWVVWLPVATLCGVGALATGSRTGLVAAAAAIALGLVHLVVRGHWRGVLAAVLIGLVGWMGFQRLPAEYVPDRLFHVEASVESRDLSNRENIWAAAMEGPATGVGIGAGAAQDYLEGAVGKKSVAHNVWIGVLLETGILGVLLMGSVVLASARAARGSPFAGLLFLWMPMMLVASLGLSLESRRTFWFVLGLCWAARSLGVTRDRTARVGMSSRSRA